MRCISQGTQRALVCVMQQSCSTQPAVPSCDTKSEDVPPPLMGGQSIGQAYGVGWMLGPQHQWFYSSSPLGQERTACQCRQSLCSPCTQDRGTVAAHTRVGVSGGDRSPLCAACPLCMRAFVWAETALLGSAGTAISRLDGYRLVFAFYLSFALICNF